MTDAQEFELMQLRSVIGLAAFAVEARRVLNEIDQATALRPLDKKSRTNPLALVRELRQWSECPDTTAQVLSEKCNREEKICNKG